MDECRRCGGEVDRPGLDITIDGRPPRPLCAGCTAEVVNGTVHTCRACGRSFTRFDGMHATPLDPDGQLRLQDRQVRYAGEVEWRTEPDIVSRVLCASCCPASVHDDGEWCNILWPWQAE